MRPLSALETQLWDSRQAFLEFARARVDDAALAEDIVQDALVRATEGAGRLRDHDRLIPWFYRILRNAIIDAYRRRDVERRRLTTLPDELPIAGPPEPIERALCECFRALLTSLRPEQAELIDAVELGDEPPAAAAARLGISMGNLKVRRHRARRALRARLEETCRVCADHGCIDCTCEREAGGEPPAL